ncbi:MAG TPA: glycoside hydrolase, partial [Verrucomicrobiota bacterium]|nr:glycoside hydrolase [Verrucomicrobiota bacterium]
MVHHLPSAICHLPSGRSIGHIRPIGPILLLFACFVVQGALASAYSILKPAAFAHHIEHFNAMAPETIVNHIPNAQSWDWLQQNIPLFECPDRSVEEIYYFRWWSFRKHIKQTPKGFVITEFLTPVSHAGEFNTISCATSLHIAEGRWLRDDRYLNDYTRFWFRGNNGKPANKFHNFSSWIAAAAWDRYLVNQDQKFITDLLNNLVTDYRLWETERQLPNGLFWQYDVRDGMEESISGSRRAQNIRPTINTYMFANARAIANLAALAGQPNRAAEFSSKAAELKRLTQQPLWDTNA